MKPRVWFSRTADTWVLRYHFHARQMWLFGADAARRREIQLSCIQTETEESLEACYKRLRSLYRNREIWIEGKL